MDNSTPSRGARLLVFHPRQLEDAQDLIRAVKANQTVVLNASSADDGEAQRLIDFAAAAWRRSTARPTASMPRHSCSPRPGGGWCTGRWRPEASTLVRHSRTNNPSRCVCPA